MYTERSQSIPIYLGEITIQKNLTSQPFLPSKGRGYTYQVRIRRHVDPGTEWHHLHSGQKPEEGIVGTASCMILCWEIPSHPCEEKAEY